MNYQNIKIVKSFKTVSSLPLASNDVGPRPARSGDQNIAGDSFERGSLSPLKTPSPVPQCPIMVSGGFKEPEERKDCFFFVHDDAALLSRGRVPELRGVRISTLSIAYTRHHL